MVIQDKNTEEELYFVVEEAQFNLGNYDKAIQMIEMTALTGADAIEFQLAYAEDMQFIKPVNFRTNSCNKWLQPHTKTTCIL
jgi:sialic acid synthase SpsE